MTSDNFQLPGELPLDLQLDLLVDEELPEERRRALLLSLDSNPARWRDLSIRFLERQVEKKSIHQFIADAGNTPSARPQPRASNRWLTPARYTAIAAGLLIAVTSALVTTFVFRQARHADVLAGNIETINTQVPGSTVGMGQALAVEVPMVNVRQDANTQLVLPSAAGEEPLPRRSWVIKSDGTGNAVVIPVNTLPMKVY